MDTRFTDQNFGTEDLLCPVPSGSEGIVIAVRGVLGELDCKAPHAWFGLGHIEAQSTFVDIDRRCIAGPMIHLSLSSMLFSSMLCGNVIDLNLIGSPYLLVLDPLDALNLCLRHGQLEISLQPVPLIRPLT